MKFRNLLSTLLLVMVMVFTFGVTSYAATAKYSVTPSNGSTVKAGDKIEVKSDTGSNVGFLSMKITLYDADTNKVLKENENNITNKTIGNNPVWSAIIVPECNAKNLKVTVSGKGSDNKAYTKSFNFKMNQVENKMTITASVPSGSVINKGQQVTFTTTSSVKSIGVAKSQITITNNKTGETLVNKVKTSTETNGTTPFDYLKTISNEAGEYKVVINSTDINGGTKSATFIYYIYDEKEPEIPMDPVNNITITANKASGSVIAKEEIVKFSATPSISTIGIKTINVKLYNNKTNALLDDKTGTSTKTNGANPLSYNKTMPNVAGEYKAVVTATDINGKSASKSFIYTIKDGGNSEEGGEKEEGNQENDGDDEYYKGVINNDLDGLVIDLWLMQDQRFYELDKEDIPFVAYYYNADKKAAKDVTIEVEVPDGFKVVSKSTPYGSVSVKNDTIKYNIGTVPSKEVRKVFFTLKAIDDDVCEEATNVVAVILQDDDEEDQSTQRIWIYEEDGKGTFKAYVTGYPDQTFRADNNITREETAAIMARAFNHTVINTTKSFSDVKKTSWSYNYIMACTTKGIITGYTNGTFKPFNNITRAELYAMTYRAMSIPTDEKALFVPKAYKNSDAWEKNYIAGLERLKMLKDMDETDASENATRAEVVYLVNGVQFRNPSKMMDVEYTDLSSNHWCAKHIAAASCNYSFKRGANGKEIVTSK